MTDPTGPSAMATTNDGEEAAGFLVLGLAQLVCIFAFWMALWPQSFGVGRSSILGVLLGALFGAAGVAGFYVAFQALSVDA